VAAERRNARDCRENRTPPERVSSEATPDAGFQRIKVGLQKHRLPYVKPSASSAEDSVKKLHRGDALASPGRPKGSVGKQSDDKAPKRQTAHGVVYDSEKVKCGVKGAKGLGLEKGRRRRTGREAILGKKKEKRAARL